MELLTTQKGKTPAEHVQTDRQHQNTNTSTLHTELCKSNYENDKTKNKQMPLSLSELETGQEFQTMPRYSTKETNATN